MKIFRLVSRTVALGGLALLSAGAVHAQSITPVFMSSSGAAGDVTYSYQLFSTADTKVQTGDIFTMYDIQGFLNGGAFSPTFTAGQTGISYAISVQNSGLNPPGTNPVDNNGLPNVSLTYNGTSPFINLGPGSQFLGTLTFQSTNLQNGGSFNLFAANTTKNSDGTLADNTGSLVGPNSGTFASTPEPSAWAMFVGMGVSGLAFARRRNRRK